jgi:hypothetical protein
MAVLASYLTQTDFEGIGDSSGRTKLAQQFTVSSAGFITAAQIDIANNGSPGDQVSVAIAANSSGVPGTILETGSTVTAAGIGFAMATSTFTAATLLSLSTTYWLVVARTGAVNASNYVKQGVDNHSIPYGGYYRYDGSSWILAQATYNFTFEIDGNIPGASTHKLPLLGVG